MTLASVDPPADQHGAGLLSVDLRPADAAAGSGGTAGFTFDQL